MSMCESQDIKLYCRIYGIYPDIRRCYLMPASRDLYIESCYLHLRDCADPSSSYIGNKIYVSCLFKMCLYFTHAYYQLFQIIWGRIYVAVIITFTLRHFIFKTRILLLKDAAIFMV